MVRTSWASAVPEGESVAEHWCFECETWIYCCTCPPERDDSNEDDENEDDE